MTATIWRKLKVELGFWRIGALPGLVVIVAVLLARSTGGLQALEWVAFDALLRSRPPEPPDQRIVIIGINEQDIQRVGRYPLPDRVIADLLTTIKAAQPVVIGLDIFRDLPIEPGHAQLTQLFRTTPNLIAIEKVITAEASGAVAKAPAVLPPAQVGFSDARADSDGYLRRSLLGLATRSDDFRFSLSIRLVEAYLATQGITLGNGQRDSEAMQFGTIELTRFQPSTGGYVNADAGGNQILLNFRSGQTPFPIFSLHDLQTGKVKPDTLRDRIVLIGITALSVKDVVGVAAVASSPTGSTMTGVEVQAHAVSQILSAVRDARPLLHSWADSWEIVWIVVWGLAGIGVGRFVRSTWKNLLILSMVSLGLVGSCYGLLLLGWWVPLVPALLVLVLNAAGPAAVSFYRHEQDLRFRLQERQFIVKHTFDTLHNGPLQTLNRMLREAENQHLSPTTVANLQRLNQELRSLYDLRQAASDRRPVLSSPARLPRPDLAPKLTPPELTPSDRFLDKQPLDEQPLDEQPLDWQLPLHELLHEVYDRTLQRPFPGFNSIKVKVVKFDPFPPQRLSFAHKRTLCRFLEQALCRVGQETQGTTRLSIICTQEGKQQVIRVSDNGSQQAHSSPQPVAGRSRRRARLPTTFVQQFGVRVRRFPNQPQGTVDELIWSVPKFWFW